MTQPWIYMCSPSRSPLPPPSPPAPIELSHNSSEKSQLGEHKSVWYKVHGLSTITLPFITILLHNSITIELHSSILVHSSVTPSDTCTLQFGKFMIIDKFGYNSKTFRSLHTWLNKWTLHILFSVCTNLRISLQWSVMEFHPWHYLVTGALNGTNKKLRELVW